MKQLFLITCCQIIIICNCTQSTLTIPTNFWFIWSWIRNDQIPHIQQNGYGSFRKQFPDEMNNAYAPFFVFTQVAPYQLDDRIVCNEHRMWIEYAAQWNPFDCKQGLWDTIVIINSSEILNRRCMLSINGWYSGINDSNLKLDWTKYIGTDPEMRQSVIQHTIWNDQQDYTYNSQGWNQSNVQTLIDTYHQMKHLLMYIDRLTEDKTYQQEHELLFYDNIALDKILFMHQIQGHGICLDTTGSLIANNVTKEECFILH